MNKLLKLQVTIQTLIQAEEGQDIMEYALIVTLIALACCAGMSSLARVIDSAFFGNAAAVIKNAY